MSRTPPSPDPDLRSAAAMRDALDRAIGSLSYPAATKAAPGWYLQPANECRCTDHPPAPSAEFAVFWVQLGWPGDPEPPANARDVSDLALSCLALDLQLLGFNAAAQGEHYEHGGWASVLVTPH